MRIVADISDDRQLRAKQAQAVSVFPKIVVFQLHEIRAADTDNTRFYQRLLVRLEILMNEFLLDRLQYRHFQADSSDLLVTAYEMVVLVLTVWTHMDLFSEKRNFDWVVSHSFTTLFRMFELWPK